MPNVLSRNQLLVYEQEIHIGVKNKAKDWRIQCRNASQKSCGSRRSL